LDASLSIGLPRIHAENNERRDFLPAFVAGLAHVGYKIHLENGYGSGMGFTTKDYLEGAPSAQFSSWEETYQQDLVLVLRYPGDDIARWLQPGACLMSMLHFPTRPSRFELLRELDIEAVSLDSIKDDSGRRLVENLRAVAWNGVEVAMDVIRRNYPPPGFESPRRNPLRVTLMGAGAVGSHVMQAAIRYGNERYRNKLASWDIPGVLLNVVDYDLTSRQEVMQPILSQTDLLIDATQRPDASKAVIPNGWLAFLPDYAVILDLSVDPYDCSITPNEVKGVEGIPQGNLDQYIFPPDDPIYEFLPPCVPSDVRRWVVSCYSWPGIHPADCMDLYGNQIRPLVRTILESNGVHNVSPFGNYFHRAISRAMLSRWQGG